MTRSSGPTPPFSPVLLAGFLARPLPPALLQPALDVAMLLVRRRHPGVFERLAGLPDPVFVVDPVDLPLVFLLDANAQSPRLVAARAARGRRAAATIRGPLLTLIDLLEGRIDGDALFFSRELVIEGDTEAVVALRNAVDGAEIDLVGDVLSVLGPLAGPAHRVVDVAGGLFTRLTRDLEDLRAAVIAPALRQGEAQGAALHELEERVNATARRRPLREVGS